MTVTGYSIVPFSRIRRPYEDSALFMIVYIYQANDVWMHKLLCGFYRIPSGSIFDYTYLKGSGLHDYCIIYLHKNIL